MSDEKWMRRALELAQKGTGKVHPNPMVGAVLVRGGRIVGQGFHKAWGMPHAEIEALRDAGAKSRGATLFINLEPCSHWGKTPPCVDGLIRAGVKKVVAAMRDPNPLVSGRGFSALRRNGIQVVRDLLGQEALELNRAFSMWVREGRPYITLKMASSLDGKVATADGESKWITGPEARALGHKWRGRVDAIAVGIETVRRDNPSLTSHGHGKNPIRLIFDSHLRISHFAKVLDPRAKTIVLASREKTRQRRTLEKQGVQTLVAGSDREHRVNLPNALKLLAQQGVAHLLVEGGPTLQGSFFDGGFVDEVLAFVSPTVIGGTKAKASVGGRGVLSLADVWRLRNPWIGRVGKDILVHGKIDH